MVSRAEELITQLEAEIVERDARIEDLEAQLEDTESRRDNSSRNASAFEASMGGLQVENGELQARIADLEAQLLDVSAERNTCQRARITATNGWKRECEDADSIFEALGIDMGTARTDGGSLLVASVIAALKARQPSGVVLPTVEQITEALDDVTCFHDLSAELIAPALLENLRAMIGSTHAGSGVVLPERKGADPIFPFDRGFNACRAQSVPVVSSRLTTACKACGGARRVDIGTVCDSWVECSECRDQQKESE